MIKTFINHDENVLLESASDSLTRMRIARLARGRDTETWPDHNSESGSDSLTRKRMARRGAHAKVETDVAAFFPNLNHEDQSGLSDHIETFRAEESTDDEVEAATTAISKTTI